VNLYNSKIPTGDPKCPANMRKAKKLYQLIQEKMELTDGDGSDDDYEDEEDEEEEEEEEDKEEHPKLSSGFQWVC